MASTKKPSWLKRQRYLQVSKEGQIDRKKLLSRECSKERITMPVFDTSVMSKEEKKAYHQAVVIMAVVIQQAPGFQLTRDRLETESGLSYRKLAAGLKFLKERGVGRFIPVRQNSRLYGWCFQLNLDGKMKPNDGAWALHHSQSEDVDREHRTACRRYMRQKYAGLVVMKPVRNRRKSNEAVKSRESSLSRTVRISKKREALRGSPLASPIMVQPQRKKKAPLPPCQGAASFSFPAVSHDPETKHMTGTENIQTRVYDALEQINTRTMSNQAVETWWTTNAPGKLLDLCLPAGQKFTTYQKRIHMRRMRRTSAYLDKIAWHWAVTRQGGKRPGAETLTDDLGRLYDLRDDRSGTAEIDKVAMVHAYRRVVVCNGATWAEFSPKAASDIIDHEYLYPLLGAEGMLDELAQAEQIMLDAKNVLDQKLMKQDDVIYRYIRLRSWVTCVLGGSVAIVFDHHCKRLNLDPATNSNLKQWFVHTEAGRRSWKSVCYCWSYDAERARYVTGHTRNEWVQAVDDHAAASTLLEAAYQNMNWQHKTVRDYAIF